MEALLRATPRNGKLDFANKEDYEKFCIQFDGVEQIVSFKQYAKTGEKMKLYAYYHGPLLSVAVIGYTYAGWEGIDKVKADYLLRSEFGKTFIRKPDNTYVPVMEDKDKMSKARLHKFIEDCIFYIEQELQQTIPDSESYKISKQTGRDFKRLEP